MTFFDVGRSKRSKLQARTPSSSGEIKLSKGVPLAINRLLLIYLPSFPIASQPPQHGARYHGSGRRAGNQAGYLKTGTVVPAEGGAGAAVQTGEAGDQAG